jgi:NAD+ synthase (glutamine-hydrolysing)
MRIGLAQIDARVGDLAGNAARIVAAARAAEGAGAELVLLPELSVTGAPPRDLLLDDGFVDAAIAATGRLAAELWPGPPVLVGTVTRAPSRAPGHPGLFNALALLEGGRVAAAREKRLLPAYDVFHEPRWFLPGPARGPLAVGGRAVGALVCEDLWAEGYGVDPPADLARAGADLLVCAAASPYRIGVLERRRHHARRAGRPLVYVNAVGAQDELIFDGGSFALDGEGRLLAALPRFEEAVLVVDLDAAEPLEVGEVAPPDGEGELFAALVLGVRGFARKNGVRRAVLGLSGGVDSALAACIAREALGPDAVTAIAIPSRHTDPRSTEAARALAAALGVRFEVVPLEPLHAAAERALAPITAGAGAGDTTLENVQARLRALILMAHVNRHGGALLNTSNKTELALGYGTLYGDLAGALCVLGDLTKPQVYALARRYDGGRGVIPPFILDRAPTAELRDGQVDPFDYPTVAPLVEALIQGAPPPPGASPEDLARYRRMIRAAEHKRWQAGVVLKVSERAFGTGRMMPITRAEHAR